MRASWAISILCIIFFIGCKKASINKEHTYVFLTPYCATVTVGGVVGIREKCFSQGDTVLGKRITEGEVTIRIASHSAINDQPAGPWSYQEFLNVPSENLIITSK